MIVIKPDYSSKKIGNARKAGVVFLAIFAAIAIIVAGVAAMSIVTSLVENYGEMAIWAVRLLFMVGIFATTLHAVDQCLKLIGERLQLSGYGG
jgi:hypothetical protein